MSSHFDQVGEFHKKFNLLTSDDIVPSGLSDHVFLFRYQFLMEELQELLASHRKGDLAGFADALVDLVYVALGTAHLAGIPFDDVFVEVQRANMQKERSVENDPRSKRGHFLDIVKPEGWTPPNVQAILDRRWAHIQNKRNDEL